MRQYLYLLKEVLGKGDVMFEPRTEVYTIGLPGSQSVYDLREGFPLVMTKKINPRLPFEELLWKLRGERSVKPLYDRNVHIWDENAFDHYLKRNGLREKMPKHTEAWEDGFKEYKERLVTDSDADALGDLGPVYGYQWRHGFKRNGEEIDQLKNVIEGIEEKPGSRYHLMTAWNPSDLPDSALGPCPMIHHFHVFGDNLDLHVFQRSCDIFLGVPFNIAQDSLLLYLVAKETKLKPRYFVHTYSSAHAYLGVRPRADFWADSDNVREFQGRFNDVKVLDKPRTSVRGYFEHPNARRTSFRGNFSKAEVVQNKTQGLFDIRERANYSELLDWYLDKAPSEGELHEGKDHVPYILRQLSKEPRELPTIELKDVGFWDAINMRAGDIVEVKGYNPHEWDSKARMAV